MLQREENTKTVPSHFWKKFGFCGINIFRFVEQEYPSHSYFMPRGTIELRGSILNKNTKFDQRRGVCTMESL